MFSCGCHIQAAFFNAYRADASNPEYAFNLAVSLDQLGQRNAALQYYRNALSLAERQPTAFELDAVERRIRVITAE